MPDPPEFPNIIINEKNEFEAGDLDIALLEKQHTSFIDSNSKTTDKAQGNSDITPSCSSVEPSSSKKKSSFEQSDESDSQMRSDNRESVDSPKTIKIRESTSKGSPRIENKSKRSQKSEALKSSNIISPETQITRRIPAEESLSHSRGYDSITGSEESSDEALDYVQGYSGEGKSRTKDPGLNGLGKNLRKPKTIQKDSYYDSSSQSSDSELYTRTSFKKRSHFTPKSSKIQIKRKTNRDASPEKGNTETHHKRLKNSGESNASLQMDAATLKFRKTVLYQQSDLKQQVQYLTSLTREMAQVLLERTTVNEEIPHLEFPMKAINDLCDLEERMVDASFRTQIINKLSSWGGSSVKSTVRRILVETIAHKLALNINWVGANGKKEFKKLILTQTIKEAVRKNTKFIRSTDFEIEKAIQSWFKHAADRNGGRKQRAQKK